MARIAICDPAKSEMGCKNPISESQIAARAITNSQNRDPIVRPTNRKSQFASCKPYEKANRKLRLVAKSPIYH
ncbi:hypothetical protein NDU88_001766 [Pleurodeles waltl]|uniref:Uncharacterized protein n=1 Tax=Pleurodeles waltl TaxID=8319 RepID=A0AAV7WLX4_PLEWA|nr:hypothetical protein NDU88_001766 [Pleurodeles waltl]